MCSFHSIPAGNRIAYWSWASNQHELIQTQSCWMTRCYYLYMVLWSSSWHHAHLVIQSYTYKRTHTIIQWCCTQVCDAFPWEVVYETFLWKAVLIPSSLRLHRCSSADWLSDPWPLRLSPVQFTRVMVGSLVLATATHAVPDRESGFAFFYHFTASMPPLLLRFFKL